MMPVIRISDAAFLDLKSIATWLDAKTPSEAIHLLVQQEMQRLGLERDDATDGDSGDQITGDPMEFKVAPGLSFTKPLAASINGKPVHSPRWSSILLAMIAQVQKSEGLEGKKLVSALTIPARAERYEQEGFKYHSNLGISVQGQSASDVWKEVERLATTHRIPVVVEFWWRNNPKAQFPGRTGRLRAS